MALSRATLAVELGDALAGWLALAGLEPLDAAGHLKLPLDRTWRDLGVAESELATAELPDSQREAATRLATYYALRQVQGRLGPRANVSVSGVGVSKSAAQEYEQLERAIAEARLLALPHGLSETSTMTAGAWRVDILEPAATEVT